MKNNIKNILVISHSGRMGGAETVLSSLINNVLSNKSEYKLYITYPLFLGNEFKKSIRVKNIGWIKSFLYKNDSSNFIKSLLGLVYNIPFIIYFYVYCIISKIDVIYVNTSVNLCGIILARLCNIKFIWHIHEQPNALVKVIPQYLKWLYKKLFMSKNGKIIFVSNRTKELWCNYLSIKDSYKLNVIYSPLKTINIVKNEHPYISFGYLGKLSHSKNIFSLMEAYKNIILNYPKIVTKLILSGDGDIYEEILKYSERLEITNHFEIMKFNPDTSFFFSKIDILVQPSLNESWGLVVLEGLLMNKAVISTKESGLIEILENEKDCLFIDPLNVEDLYEKMAFLLVNEEKRIKIAENGYDKIKSLDLSNNFIKQIKTLI